MRSNDAAISAGESSHAHRLDGENREDARHEIEDQAAEKGESQNGEQAEVIARRDRRDGAVRLMRRRGARSRCAPGLRRGDDRQVAFTPLGVLERKHPGERGLGIKGLARLESE